MKMKSKFIHLAIQIPQFITSHLISLLLTALSHLPIFKSPQSPSSSSSSSANYILILDPSSPSLLPVPVSLVTASIKTAIPIVPYSDFAQSHATTDTGSETDNPVCTVCLDCIDGDHLVRELVNCKHLFHRECLDRWLDVGQVNTVNCPLCRSLLLPPKKLLSSVSSTTRTMI